MISRIFYTLTFILLGLASFSQTKKLHDTVLVESLIDSATSYNDFDYKKSLVFGDSALRVSRRINHRISEINSLNVLADNYWFHSDFINAQKFYFRSYKLSDSIGYTKGIATAFYNIGWILCIQQHNYKEIHYLYDAYRINIELKDTSAIGKSLNALASCYSDKFKFDQKRPDFDSSLKYYTIAIDIGKRNAFRKRNLAIIYGNLGELFGAQGDYKTAIFYTEKGLEIHQKSKDSSSIINSFNNLAAYNVEMNNGKKGVELALYVYNYSLRNDSREFTKNSLLILADAYNLLGESKKAFDALHEYHKIKETLDREAYSTELRQMQSNDEISKRETDLMQIRQENEIQELKNKRKTIYISVLLGIGIVIIVIAYLLFRQVKLRQASNLKLTEQNKIISEKKLEIEQSIEYAKGIQTAFLPGTDELNLLVKENFILYKPKDVVSGDFYWYLSTPEQNGVLIACADCTGHGVPGALMSMVGINILQQLGVERKMHSPSSILKYLNAEMKNSLKQNSDQSIQRDGMDIALIHLDLDSKKLTYAGANRPLYLIRNGEAIEYKATKQAIGGFTNFDQSFDESKIELQSGDFICLSTDGYADQFGGPDAKKFMTKNLKALLVKIAPLSAKEQLSELEKVFNNWKGQQMQVDDVCLIGIKV